MKRTMLGLWGVVCLLSAEAQTPQLINYQGRLVNGTNLVNGNVGLSLRLFDASSGGTKLYEDSNAVTVADGLYSTFIGDNTTSGSLTNALAETNVFIEVAVNGNALSPRERMVSVAYALGAQTAAGVVANAITASMIATGAIQALHLAPGAVTTAAIADGSITSGDLATGSVTTAAIADGTVGAADVQRDGIFYALAAAVRDPAPTNSGVFGARLARIRDDLWVAGDPLHSVTGMYAGRVYLINGSGTVLATISNPPPPGRFGHSLAGIGSNLFFVGAPYATISASEEGMGFIYNTSGSLLTTLTNPTPQSMDNFGWAAAGLGTDRVAVSAVMDMFGVVRSGSVHLFDTAGTLLRTLGRPETNDSQFFGQSLAAVGTNRIAVGAPGSNLGATMAGAVYVYDGAGNYLLTVTNPAPQAYDFFGSSLAAVGEDRLLVAAERDNSSQGRAFLYDLAGNLVATFTDPTPSNNQNFAYSVAAAGTNLIVIGAPYDSSDGLVGGAAFVFRADGTFVQALHNPSPLKSGNFGGAVAALTANRFVVGDTTVISSPQDGGNCYVYSLDPLSTGLFVQAAASLIGNIGTGQFSAYADLEAEGFLDGNAQGDLLLLSQGDGRYFNTNELLRALDGTAAAPSYSFNRDDGTGMFRVNTNQLGFSTAGQLRMMVSTNGFVGFRTTNPVEVAHVAGNLLVTGFPMVAQSVLAPVSSTTITPPSGYVLLQPTSNITLSSSSAIANGSRAGQLLMLQGSSSFTSTVPDNANTRLGAARALGTNDILQLIWNGAAWVEISYSDN